MEAQKIFQVASNAWHGQVAEMEEDADAGNVDDSVHLASTALPPGLTEGLMVVTHDGRVHHVRTPDQRYMLEFAMDTPLEEYRLMLGEELQQSEGNRLVIDRPLIIFRMQLTNVQPGRAEGFNSEEDLEAYLASARLGLRDVPYDGDCWLSVIAAHIIGYHKFQHDGMKMHTQKLRTLLTHYADDGTPAWLMEQSRQELSTKKASSNEEALLLLASMTKRVIQVYRTYPTPQELARRLLPRSEVVLSDTEAQWRQHAPFSMQYICPQGGTQLESTEPIRVLQLLPAFALSAVDNQQYWYPGHFMRIVPLADLAVEDEKVAKLKEKRERDNKVKDAKGTKRKRR